MCVQELDFDCLNSFKSCLSHSYDFKYKRRTGEDKIDGVCMFWIKSRWSCLDYVDVEFHLYDDDPLLDRHNVAQIAVLKETKESENIVIVANTHLLFNPKRGDIKLRQLEILMFELNKTRERVVKKTRTEPHILLMGDFNSVPGSAIYEFLSKGDLDTSNLNRKLISGQWNPLTMSEWREIEYTCDSRHLGRGTCMRIFQSNRDAAFFIRDGVRFCRQDDSCKDVRCPYRHKSGTSRVGIRCRDGASCSNKTCTWWHEGRNSTDSDFVLHVDDDDDDNGNKNEQHIEKKIYILKHNMALQSAYSESETTLTTGEPAFTTYHARFKGTVDYIW